MRLITWMLAAVLLAGCSLGKAPTTPEQPKPQPVTDGSKLSSAEAEQIIKARATAAVNAIKTKNLKGFAHPDKGIRFSPYAQVDASKDVVIAAADWGRDLFSEKKLYQWGTFDGSGEPINLGLTDYWQRFVYGHDFAAAPQVGYNAFKRGGTNTPNNAREAYPTAIFVDYHFPGFDPKVEGMDWQTLRLAFEQKDGQWYLVGIIHDQWTI